MDFSDSSGVLWRRKGLTFTLLLLTLMGTISAGVILPWTYKASVTETLINSKKSSQAIGDGNPYLSYDAAMVALASVLTFKLMNSQNSLALENQGDTASFQAQVLSEDPEDEEPFIQISVSGSNKAAVAQTLQGTAASLNTLLAQLQAGIPNPERASLQVIAELSTPVRSTGAKLKPLVGFLGVGLVLTFLVPQAVEGSARRRRKSRAVMTTSVDDQTESRSESRSIGQRTESDRFSQSHARHTRSESVQRPGSDGQLRV